MATAYDADTISFYDREADAYATFRKRSPQLESFISRLAIGAKVLELGCGAGHDAEALIAAGMTGYGDGRFQQTGGARLPANWAPCACYALRRVE